MGRIFALLWIVLTVTVNIFALDAMFVEFDRTAIHWKQPIYGLERLYFLASYSGFSTVGEYIQYVAHTVWSAISGGILEVVSTRGRSALWKSQIFVFRTVAS